MINSLQYMRAFASLMVVFLHSSIQYSHNIDKSFIQYKYFYDLGSMGVDLFFVISGFIIHYVHHSNLKTFIRGRLIRILPIYWLLTILYVLLSSLNPNTLYQFDYLHFLFSMFTVPYPTVSGAHSPVLWVAWTLSYEMFFYVTYGLLVVRYNLNIVFFILFLTIYPIINIGNDYIQTKDIFISPLILEFLFGVILAEMYKNNKIKNKYNYFYLCIIFIFISSSIYFTFDDYYRFLYYGIPSLLIIKIMLNLNEVYQFRNKIILLLGEASYSLYLTHIFILSILVKIWTHYDLYTNIFLFIITATLMTNITAIFFHLFIEKKINNLLRKKLS